MFAPTQPKYSQLLYASAVVVPFLLLIILAGFARSTVTSLESARLLVDRTFILKRDLALLLRSVVDAETAQRGFILTQHEEFLEPYNYSLTNIPLVENRIEETILDPDARVLFHQAQGAIDARMTFTTETIEIQRSGQHDKAVAVVATGKGKALMDEVRTRFDAIEARQDYLLGIRQEQHREHARLNEHATWLLIALDLLFVGLVIYLIAHLRRAQAMLHVCAWSQTVEYQGEWLTYEEYLLRRFGLHVTHGISPAEADKFFAKKNEPARHD
jgi:CHASE3 domain sensor protein